MFMRANRSKNGAPQPEKTAGANAAAQKAARKLSPNEPLDGKPDDWRFNPDMESCATINDDHYEGGVGGLGPYGKSYEQHIPFVGNTVPSSPDRKLKNP